MEGAFICTECGKPTSASGEYEGPTTNAEGAISSLVMGVIGLFVLGFIFGPLAIRAGNRARKAIAEDVALTGGGYAAAGIVLGWIAIIAWIVLLLIRLSL
jgi:hypothetical protein